ncbi:MAG: rod-binding protein [Candidatus Nitrospinota bacterium M3_3B_026]
MDINSAGNVQAAGKPRQASRGLGLKELESLSGDKSISEKEKLEVLAKEFESILFHQMIKSMRSTVEKSGLIKESSGERIFTDMLDEKMAREMAFSQHDGLSSALVAQLMPALEDDGSGPKNPPAGEPGRR